MTKWTVYLGSNLPPIRVWLIDLLNFDEESMLDDLSQNEKNRASAFVDLKSKKQFVVMRSILKKIVRNWFGKKTASIKLTNTKCKLCVLQFYVCH